MVTFPFQELMVIDIETAPNAAVFTDLDERWQTLWTDKVQRQLPEDTDAAAFYPQRAGVMAEFARVVCICAAVFTGDGLRVKSFEHEDERTLLQQFAAVASSTTKSGKPWCFAGHNIREFDIPFLCRRMLIHGLPLPDALSFQNKKPWEIPVVDTFQLWRFGDFKNYTSLNLLAAALGLSSPKEDIDGSMVGALFWEPDPEQQRKNVARIVTYCKKDVVTTANILRRFSALPIIEEEAVEYTWEMG